MSSESKRVKQALGIIISIIIFMVWIVVDMYLFPGIADSLGYPTFELIAYGSWFAVLLIMLSILSVTDAIPGFPKLHDDNTED